MLIGIAVTHTTGMDASWTTIHLAAAAVRKGHQVRLFQLSDVDIEQDGRPASRAFCLDPDGGGDQTPEGIAEHLRTRTLPRRWLTLSRLDLLLWRSAPLSLDLLALATRLADLGVMVVNNPRTLPMVSHKGWLQTLGDMPIPATLITMSPSRAELFAEDLNADVVLKPARGSGGRGVTRIGRGRLSELHDAFLAIREASGHVVVQRYLEEADQGEKRLLWCNGKILGGYLRQRAPGRLQHNVHQGASTHPTIVTSADLAAADQVSPHLIRAGILFAGIDLIGGKIVEVNVVNPGGSVLTDVLHGSDTSGDIIDCLTSLCPRSPPEDTWERPVP